MTTQQNLKETHPKGCKGPHRWAPDPPNLFCEATWKVYKAVRRR